MQKWKNDPTVFTPGGDPYYYCPVCGEGGHVNGIESPYPKDKCPDCGTPLEY